MNILIHTQYFWPENFQINNIASDLADKGHNVHILTGKPNYPQGKIYEGYKSAGIEFEKFGEVFIHRIPMLPRYKGSGISISINYLSFFFSSLLFSPFVLRNKKFDIIFVYGTSPIFQSIPASFLGFLKKIPVVLWVQDLWPESVASTGFINSKLLLWIIDKIVHFTYKHSDLILVQSKAFKSKILMKTSKNKKIKYHPNSTNNLFYSFTESENKNKCKVKSMQSGFTVVFAGNIGEAQSIETIVAASKLLTKFLDIKIIFFGNGSKFQWLKDIIKREKINNIFLEGSYPEEAMPYILKRASVLLVTLNNDDIFKLTIPNKIQAYLAVGRPIMACLEGEGANLVREAKAGLTTKSNDSSGLAKGVIDLYNMDTNKLNKFGTNGRNYFKKFFMMDDLNNKLIKHFKACQKVSNLK